MDTFLPEEQHFCVGERPSVPQQDQSVANLYFDATQSLQSSYGALLKLTGVLHVSAFCSGLQIYRGSKKTKQHVLPATLLPPSELRVALKFRSATDITITDTTLNAARSVITELVVVGVTCVGSTVGSSYILQICDLTYLTVGLLRCHCCSVSDRQQNNAINNPDITCCGDSLRRDSPRPGDHLLHLWNRIQGYRTEDGHRRVSLLSLPHSARSTTKGSQRRLGCVHGGQSMSVAHLPSSILLVDT